MTKHDYIKPGRKPNYWPNTPLTWSQTGDYNSKTQHLQGTFSETRLPINYEFISIAITTVTTSKSIFRYRETPGSVA
ncbi:MAG: hypothetical protein ACYS30_05280 [Planctomycetota bacterium]